MKQQFDNSGFAQVQATILSLPAEQLTSEMQHMRSNFSDWLNDKFSLTASQLQQLHDLDPTFRQSIADSVANSWAQRIPIIFDKQPFVVTSQSEDEKPPRKDILIRESKTKSQHVESEEVIEHVDVIVQIVYN